MTCDCQTDIEEVLAIEFCVHGYHVYNDIRSSCLGKSYRVEYEARNMKDCCSYAVGTSAFKFLWWQSLATPSSRK